MSSPNNTKQEKIHEISNTKLARFDPSEVLNNEEACESAGLDCDRVEGETGPLDEALREEEELGAPDTVVPVVGGETAKLPPRCGVVVAAGAVTVADDDEAAEG